MKLERKRAKRREDQREARDIISYDKDYESLACSGITSKGIWYRILDTITPP
jgi:hypothetical protein